MKIRRVERKEERKRGKRERDSEHARAKDTATGNEQKKLSNKRATRKQQQKQVKRREIDETSRNKRS